MSDGGLAVAVAEACVGPPYANATLGATLDCSAYAGALAFEALLFGEDGARAIVSCDSTRGDALSALAGTLGVPFSLVGSVGAVGGALTIMHGSTTATWDIGRLRQIYMDAIPRRMRQGSLASTGEDR